MRTTVQIVAVAMWVATLGGSTSVAAQTTDAATSSTKEPAAAPTALVVLGGVGLAPAAGVTALKVLVLAFGVFACLPAEVDPGDGNHAPPYGVRYLGCVGGAATAADSWYGSAYVWIPAAAGLAIAGVGGLWLRAVAGGRATTVTAPPVGATPSVPLTLGVWATPGRIEPSLPATVAVPILSGRF